MIRIHRRAQDIARDVEGVFHASHNRGSGDFVGGDVKCGAPRHQKLEPGCNGKKILPI